MADPGRIPGSVVIPNCIQIRLIWTLASGKSVYNVLHGSVGSGFTATAAIAEAIRAGITTGTTWTNYAGLLNTATSLAGVDLRDLRTANMPIVQSTGAATPGTGSQGALPPGVAFVITERTAAAGRSNRGRIFLPGWDRSALTVAGVATAGASNAAVAWVGLVNTTLTAQSISQALANPARNLYTGRKGAVHVARPAGVVLITSNVARSVTMNSQRRRAQVA